MNAVMQFCETTLNPFILVFTVSNLAAMGLQVDGARCCRGVAEQEIPGVDLRLGLGGRACVWLSDYQSHSSGGAIRDRGAPLQSGAVRTVPPADGGKSPRRHELCGSPHTAGGGRHGGVDAVDGAAADSGADDQHLGAREAAPSDHSPSADRRSGDPALRPDGGNQDLSRRSRDRACSSRWRRS